MIFFYISIWFFVIGRKLGDKYGIKNLIDTATKTTLEGVIPKNVEVTVGLIGNETANKIRGIK